jgi:uncharacterized protein YbjT (DUF2867 family)
MKIVLFGATGMVGQGALRECLLDREVEQVLSVGRSSAGQVDPKLRECVVQNLVDLSGVEQELSGYDACLFCMGGSATGLNEAEYRRINYELPLSVANALLQQNPALTFQYVSGAGTDSTERGRAMWARVKGATENALLRMPFKAAYMLRPGLIQPLHGIVSKTALYRYLYSITGVLFPLLKALFPKSILTTEDLGRAMLQIAKHGAPKSILEASDINALVPPKPAAS